MANKELRVAYCQEPIGNNQICNTHIWYNINYVDSPPTRCGNHIPYDSYADYDFSRKLDAFDDHCKKHRITSLMASARDYYLKSFKTKKVPKPALTLSQRYELGEYGSDLNALGSVTVTLPRRPK